MKCNSIIKNGKSLRNESYRHIDRYPKTGVSKGIAHEIKHANFQLYRVHPDGVI